MTDPRPVPGELVTARPFPHFFWFGLLLSVALVLAGASLTVGAYTAAGLPETVVREYFAALQRGDAAAALGYGTIPTGSRDLLTGAVLAAQNATGPIEDVTVARVRRSGNTATVDVTYTVGLHSGPVAMADSVPVVADGHAWRLAHSAVPESVSPGDGSQLASLAGAAVPDGDFLMFPGALPITYDTPELAASPNASVVHFDGGGVIEADAIVTAAGRAALTPAVDAAVRACLAGASPTQALCPLPNELAGVPGSLRGKETRTPILSFQVDDPTGRVHVHGDVPLGGATYQLLDDNNIAATTPAKALSFNAFSYVAGPARVWWGTS